MCLLPGDIGERAGRGDQPLDVELVRVQEKADHRLDVVRIAELVRRVACAGPFPGMTSSGGRSDETMTRGRVGASVARTGNEVQAQTMARPPAAARTVRRIEVPLTE